ncbi:MAG: LamG-like jellyroll fold domain-containing protein [Planctomycetota bacterium]
MWFRRYRCVAAMVAVSLICFVSCEEEKQKPVKEEVKGPSSEKKPSDESQPPLPPPLDTLIPRPKKVEILKKHIPVSRAKILLVGNDEKLRIAAEEINDRITSEGGVALETSEYSPRTLPDRGAAILLLSAGDMNANLLIRKHKLPVSPTDPGKEGYIIRFLREGDLDLIVLAGSDPQGTLYAAVTLRHMISKGADHFAASAANVADRPDFKIRQIGTPWAVTRRYPYYEMKAAAEKGDMAKAEEYEKELLASQKEYIDWLLRHKINSMTQICQFWRHTPEGETPFLRQVCRKINAYAKARGVGAMVFASSCIWTDQDGDNPDVKGCVYHPSHHRFFCWSKLDYHKKKARAFAEYLRDCDYDAFYLHAADGGGWRNPALWNDRCERCKKNYGDDHAKADAVVFGLYYDTIRKLAPRVKFVAVVYPYSPCYLDPAYIEEQIRGESGNLPNAKDLAQETSGKHRQFLERINTLLPKDIYVCVREDTQKRIDLMREAYGKRNFHLYYEYAYWKGWRPLFLTTPRWTKTFLYGGYEDIIFGNNSSCGLNPLTQMYGVECAWNTDGPGRWFFPSKQAWMDPQQCLVPRDTARAFAEIACRDLWGDVAGPLLVPVFMGNISFYFIEDPESVAEKCNLTDIPDLMKQQHEAAASATKSLAQLWTKIKEARKQKRSLMTPYAQRCIPDYYKLMLGARVLAGFKCRMMAAQGAVIAGDRDGADQLVALLRDTLQKDEQDLAALRAEMKDEPCTMRNWQKKSTYGAFVCLDVKELRAELDKFDAGREQLFTAYNIPKWFKDEAQKRTLYAVLTSEPIAIDGKLDEGAWKKAAPVEHFVYYKSLRLACRETICRILYDAKNIYFAFECFDPQAKNIKIPKRDRDQHAVCESVEVLLDPNQTKTTFHHWIVDAAGNLFDAARLAKDGGPPTYSPAFNGTARLAVQVLPDRWTAEIAIPFSDLGVTPKTGTIWGANVCRNICTGLEQSKEEPVAAGYMDGKGFHAVEAYPTLSFVESAPPCPPADVVWKISGPKMVYETTGTGAGTRLALDLVIEPDITIHNAAMSAEMWVGDKRLGGLDILKEPRIELIWRNRKPIVVHLDEMPPGVEMIFTLKADEGQWISRYVFGQPPRRKGAAPTFAPGVDGQALASPAFLGASHLRNGQPIQHIRSNSGTIEFWVRPNWNGERSLGGRRHMAHVFADVGPIRYDHPYLTNTRSIALYDTGHGSLHFTMTNERYDSRSVSASIADWKAGEWHHVAAQWQIGDKGDCDMAIYVDGKKVLDKVQVGKYPEFRKADEMLPIQIGAMNTGVCPADAAMDELRISIEPRYQADFSPMKRPEPDDKTAVIFHFDGNLEGQSGMDKQTVAAEPGSAG